MRIYFATTNTNYGCHEAIVDRQVKNLLFSYWYRSCLNQWEKLVMLLDKPNIMIDSGAFSAWTSKKTIDREDYLKFITVFKERMSKYCSDIHVVNLDVIPGVFGQKPTQAQIDESAEKGWENYEWFKKRGVKTIHVFHQHEDFHWLERLSADADYIGISPANDLNTANRLPWLQKVFRTIGTKNKTHSFGGIAKDLVSSVPFYSGDSSSFALSRVWTPKYHGKKVQSDIPVKQMQLVLRKKIREEIIKRQLLERETTALWEMRGTIW